MRAGWHAAQKLFRECVGLVKFSLGRCIAGCAIGFLLGWLQAALAPLALIALPQTIMLVMLYCWSGWLPVIVGMVTMTFSLSVTFGQHMIWASMVLFLLPSMVMIYQLDRRKGMAARLTGAIVSQVAAIFVVIVAAYALIRGDLADALFEYMRGVLAEQPESIRDSLYAAIEPMIPSTGADMAVAEYLEASFDTMAAELKLQMPGMALSSGALTGVLAVAWGSGICVRRGDDPPVSYQPLSDWYVPNNITGGMLVCLLLSALLTYLGVGGADSVMYAMTVILRLALYIQALAFIARIMKMRGYSRMARNLLLVLFVIIGSYVLWFIGAFISLFGRRGAVTEFLAKLKNKNNGEGDGE